MFLFTSCYGLFSLHHSETPPAAPHCTLRFWLDWQLTRVMAVAQLSPASSISWSTLKPYSVKSSSSMCCASSCLWSSCSSVSTCRCSCVQPFISKLYPRYLMAWAMVDAALLLTRSLCWLLAAVDRGHVPPVWARTAAAREVTRTPMPTRARTLNIQREANWERRHRESTREITWLSHSGGSFKTKAFYMKPTVDAHFTSDETTSSIIQIIT